LRSVVECKMVLRSLAIANALLVRNEPLKSVSMGLNTKGNEASTYSMICKKRLPLLQPVDRMDVTSNEPSKEKEEYRGENGPLDDDAFLTRWLVYPSSPPTE